MFDLEYEYEDALKGRDIWLEIQDRYHITNQWGVILFISDEYILNNEAVQLIPDYMKKNNLNEVLIIKEKDNLSKIGEIENVKYHLLCKSEIAKVLKYYKLIHFCKNIAVISLEEPYGNKYICKNKEIAYRDYIASAIFKLEG